MIGDITCSKQKVGSSSEPGSAKVLPELPAPVPEAGPRSRTDSTEATKRRMCHGGGPRTVPGRGPGRSPFRSWRASRPHPVARPDRGVRVAAGSGARRRQAVCRVLGRRLRLAVGGGGPQPVVPIHGSGRGAFESTSFTNARPTRAPPRSSSSMAGRARSSSSTRSSRC